MVRDAVPGTPSFVRRCLAYTFDTLPIVLLVFLVVSWLTGFAEIIREWIDNPHDTEARVRFLFYRNVVRDLSACLWVVYCAVFESSALRGSPGKYLQGLQVVNTNGEPISPRQAWLRNGSKVLSALPLCLGFAWAAFDKNGQAWHDRIARTYVVRR